MSGSDASDSAYTVGKARLETAIAREPENAELRLELGTLALVAGEFEAAEAAARRASELAPRDPRPHMCLADVFAETGRPEEAASAYREAARLGAGTATGELASLELELLTRELALIHRPLEKARASVESGEPGASELNRLGGLELLAGDVEKAAAAFRRALDTEPGRLQAALNFGFVQGLASVEPTRLKRSVRELLDAAERFPEEPRLHLHLAELYESSSLYDASIQRIEKALDVSPSCIEAYDLAARYSLLAPGPAGAGEVTPLGRKIDGIVAGLERELAAAPGDADRKRALAAALVGRERHRRAGQSFPDPARAESEARGRSGAGGTAGPLSGPAAPVGRTEGADGDTARALSLWTEVVEAGGGADEEAAIRLAEIEEETGRIDRAEDLLRRAADARPLSYRPVFELAGLRLRTGRPDDAAGLFAKAVELAPEEATTYQSLRYALSRSRKLRLAELGARTELGRDPESVSARVALGRAYLDAQRLDAAVEMLEEATRLAEGQAPGSSAASPKAAAARLPAATVGGAALDITGVGEAALSSADLAGASVAPSFAALGRALVRKGRSEAAEDAFRRAIEFDPSLAEPHRGLGNLLLGRPDTRREGIRELERYRDLRAGGSGP